MVTVSTKVNPRTRKSDAEVLEESRNTVSRVKSNLASFEERDKNKEEETRTTSRNRESRIPKTADDLLKSIGIEPLTRKREDQIRRDSVRRMQGTIDLIEEQSREEIELARERDIERQGRTRGVNVASRLQGSPFAGAAARRTEKIGEDERAAIRRKRDAQIAAALGEADRIATDRIDKERDRQVQAGEEVLRLRREEKEEFRTRAISSVENLGAAGIDAEEFKLAEPERYENLLEASGLTEFELDAFIEAAKPAELQIDYVHEQIIADAEGNAVLQRIGLDPKTGQQVTKRFDLGISFEEAGGGGGAQGFKTVKTDNGVFLVPDKFDFSKSLDEQAIFLGGGSGGGGSDVFTDTQVNKGAANAGVGRDAFLSFSEDAQNFFINTNVNSSKKEIDDAFADGASIEEVNTAIDDLGAPTEVADFLKRHAQTSQGKNAPQEFIDADFLKNELFASLDLGSAAKEAGFTSGGFFGVGGGGDIDAFLESIMSFVQQQRAFGLTDEKILEEIRKAQK